MKNLLILIAFVMATTAFVAQNDTNQGYVITLKATGFPDSTIFELHDLELEKIVDSAYLIKGELVLEGAVFEPYVSLLTSKYNPDTKERPKQIYFWVENTNISIIADKENFGAAKITGSSLNDYGLKLKNLVRRYDVSRDSLLQIYFKDKEKNKYVWDIIKKNDHITDSLTIGFIKSNPNNRVSLNMLKYKKRELSKLDLKKIYDNLSHELKSSSDGKAILAYINLKKVPDVGDVLTEIKAKDLTGKPYSLKEIKSKLILLDFWAAGCGPCRMQNKELAALYKKLKSKGLEIVSFSLDKNVANWQKASTQDSISWINISDNNGYSSPFVMSYDISGIPASYLINEKGVIIEKFHGYDDKGGLPKKLEELLNKTNNPF